MPIMIRSKTIAAIACAVLCVLPVSSHARSAHNRIEAAVKKYLASHPDEIGEIAKAYVLRHPEVIQQALEELRRRTAADAAAKKTAALKRDAAEIFRSPHQVMLGNPRAEVTLVEFFDYNCGFCRRALADTLDLLANDSGIRIVLKELPVLGPGSVEAAKIAVAVRMQDADGAKYLEFHRRLLGGRGAANRETALAIAKDLGLDVDRLMKDAESDEARTTIAEGRKLARDLGINGTPGYVIGNDVVLGAVGLAALKERIKLARK